MIYIFYRGEAWYPVYLKDDEEAINHAKSNEGTTSVMNLINGKFIYDIKNEKNK